MNGSHQIHPFGPMLAELSARGFYFGVDTWLRLHRWLARQAGAGAEDVSLEKIKYSMSALICQSAEQQAVFTEVFEQYFKEEKTKAAVPEPPLVLPKREEDEVPEPAGPLPTPAPAPLPAPEKVTSSRKGPIRIELRFPDNELRIWNHGAMDLAVQPLREKEWTDTFDWDIPGSIRRTILAGGIPQFVFQQRKKSPAYLVLIQQRSARDHLAAFYREMALELNRRDLDADYYYFDTSPHLVWKDRNSAHRRIPIERLASEFSGAKLLIIGPADPLLELPALRPAALALDLREMWPQMALLCNTPVPQWGLHEAALCQLFPVVPATARGLASLSPQWNALQSLTPHYWMMKHPEPSPPQLKFRGRKVPPEIITNLRRYLGAGGFRWLCATAYYPELYFELTCLFSDEAIPPLSDFSEWEQNHLWWEALHRLCLLPWFRGGHLPTLFREALREQLPEADAHLVRDQIMAVLRLPDNEAAPGSYADAGRTFTLAWLEAEQTGGKIEEFLPSEQGISIGEIEDAVGRKIWQRQQQQQQQQATESNQYEQTGSFMPPESNVNYDNPYQSQQPQDGLRLQGFISLVKKAKNFAAAREVFDQMTLEDVEPDLEFFNEMMAKSDGPEQAQSVLGLMKSAGIPPDETTFRARIRQAEHLNDAMKIFEEMRGEGVQATNYTAGPLLEKADHFSEARSVLAYLQDTRNITPDLKTYTVFLKKATVLDEAQYVFSEMRRADIRPDIIAYTTYLAKAPNYESARSVFDEMKREGVKPDPATYTTLLSKAENFQQARSTFEEMLGDGIKPNRGMYTQVMKLATNDEEADWVTAQMRSAGIGDGTIKRVRDEFEKNKPGGTSPESADPLAKQKLEWREMIAEAREPELLDSLLQSLTKDGHLYNEIILLKSRNEQVRRNRLTGVISDIDSQVQGNQIRAALLELIGSIQAEDLATGQPADEKTRPGDTPPESADPLAKRKGEWREMIVEAREPELIDSLLQSLNKDDQLYKGVILLKGRIEEIDRSLVKNIISDTDYQDKKNQIRADLLELIGSIKAEDLATGQPANEKTPPTGSYEYPESEPPDLPGTRSALDGHLDFFRTFNTGKRPSAQAITDSLKSLEKTLQELPRLVDLESYPDLDKMLRETQAGLAAALEWDEKNLFSREHFRLMANIETSLKNLTEYLDRNILGQSAA